MCLAGFTSHSQLIVTKLGYSKPNNMPPLSKKVPVILPQAQGPKGTWVNFCELTITLGCPGSDHAIFFAEMESK